MSWLSSCLPVSRWWVSHRMDAAIAAPRAPGAVTHRCVTQLPSPGPPPLPWEPPRPRPSPTGWMHRAEVQTHQGQEWGCPAANRVPPFHPPARTPQQQTPQPCTCSTEPLPAISCLQAQPTPWKSLGQPAVSVPVPNPVPRRPGSRWAALKLVGNFVNRHFPPPSTIPARRRFPIALPGRSCQSRHFS